MILLQTLLFCFFWSPRIFSSIPKVHFLLFRLFCPDLLKGTSDRGSVFVFLLVRYRFFGVRGRPKSEGAFPKLRQLVLPKDQIFSPNFYARLLWIPTPL